MHFLSRAQYSNLSLISGSDWYVQVASYMRSVLRTLTQCHSNHILHRDVKPGTCKIQLYFSTLMSNACTSCLVTCTCADPCR